MGFVMVATLVMVQIAIVLRVANDVTGKAKRV